MNNPSIMEIKSQTSVIPPPVIAVKPPAPANNPYWYQIEVSTRCNYDCWYCAGRSMDQADLSFERFMEIVEKIPKGSVVALQGEGEPTLWRHFEQAVEYLAERGFTLYSIINGSIIYPELFDKYFPLIGVSVDTLIPEVAAKIGRHGLKKVLKNIQTLKDTMGSHRIKIHTTYNGQDVGGLVEWVRSNGFIHFAQKVNKKSDYAVNYTNAVLLGCSNPAVSLRIFPIIQPNLQGAGIRELVSSLCNALIKYFLQRKHAERDHGVVTVLSAQAIDLQASFEDARQDSRIAFKFSGNFLGWLVCVHRLVPFVCCSLDRL